MRRHETATWAGRALDMGVLASPCRHFGTSGNDFLQLSARRICAQLPYPCKAIAFPDQGKPVCAAVTALSCEFTLSDTPHVMGCVADPQASLCPPRWQQISRPLFDYQIFGPFISMAPNAQALTQGY
ncbi:MAG TPA: hypothetical protein VFW93_11070 [Aquabacterium sp.]|uniref:hypothetical protein n=1 Tax=Aquabacterium sp. TaxID=1872578 RepID=UPI002E34C3DB|nr:hypothetical protein [Aquabacterium sp.]HEX5356750.1 hypothetical protein [Aquabacterium sp.]